MNNVLYLHRRDKDEERINRLEECIENLFGHLAANEIDLLAQGYRKETTRVIEIIKLRPRSSLVMDLKKDIEFKPVLFSKELMPLLRERDVFFATMGFDGSRWTVLHMSAPYI